MSAPVGSAFQALSYTAPVNSGAVIETSTGIAEFSSAIPAGHVMAGTPYTILVADHGSPGSVHDNYTQDGVNYPITSGNLVVH